MCDCIPKPNIETRVYFKKYDFTLIVIAYRHISPREARIALSEYCHRKGFKRPPRGGSARWYTLHGFDL